MSERKPYVGPAPYAPGGAGIEAAMTALEIELRAVRADLKAALHLIPDLSDTERQRIAAAPAGTWSDAIAGISRTVLWDRVRHEWRLGEVDGRHGWLYGTGDQDPWPLERVKEQYGPVSFTRPPNARPWDS